MKIQRATIATKVCFLTPAFSKFDVRHFLQHGPEKGVKNLMGKQTDVRSHQYMFKQSVYEKVSSS
jgi:hypothetical protein